MPKHTQLFKPKEDYQDSFKVDVVQAPSIAEGFNHAKNQEKPELTPDAIGKALPPIMPNVNNQEKPERPADDIGKEPPPDEPPPSLPNAWIYDCSIFEEGL